MTTNAAAAVPDESYPGYSPSWIGRFVRWVDTLPGSAWGYYAGFALGLLLVLSGVAWVEGAIPLGSILLPHTFLAGATAFIVGLYRHLDKRAEAALESLKPALTVDETGYAHLRRRLTTLPAGRTLLASVLILAVVLLAEAAGDTYRLEVLDGFPYSSALLRLAYLAIWWVFGAFLYHTVHQLILINSIYSKHTRIDLFRMKPLYAFSNLTAMTAGGMTLLPYGFLAANDLRSFGMLDPLALAIILSIQALAVLTFLWPQLGIHRLQSEEKQRLLDEANQRLRSVIAELHRRLDAGELAEVGELNTAISTLQLELSVLKSIPTWPWQPETVRWLVTALILPLGLWLLQFILQRLMTN